jgi:acyl-coenzyme A thioesterase PaaI-like protein
MTGPDNASAWPPAVNDSPLAHLLGFRVVEIAEGTATVTMPLTQWLLALDGTVVYGMLVTAPAVAMYGALGSLVTGALDFRPSDLRIDFFRQPAADGREITARASIAVRANDSDLAQAEVTDADGNLIAFVTQRTVRTQDPLRRTTE